ncbi:glycosyl hydrolase [Mollisia scopiformis]|uniref:Glycosyl hydrolase n=1 Tax=Mollisia scopiformis TaxID=149040 RepID=A0A132B6M9_MOLSC|nr:glycosyl hydrolase [Mollisia scopiformis]KUJ08060.1 glycosyl hydrolase [Mollisia scopiformis]
MISRLFHVSLYVLFVSSHTKASSPSEDLTNYVNPFIGTEGQGYPGTAINGGNVFPGPALPFGVVKFGIDTTAFDWTNVDANAGYTPDGYVTGVSMLHESGTGATPTYGFVHQMPLSTLENVNVLDNFTYMQERVEPDVASVGYYKTVLANGVSAELTATAHAGLVQYNFTSGSERHILVDVSHMLPSSGEAQHSQFYSNGFLARSPHGTKYQGYGVYRGGFSSRPDAPVYFCAEFDTTPEKVTLFSGPYTDPYWPNSTLPHIDPPVFTDATSVSGGQTYYSYARRIGGLFTFPSNTTTLKSKIGVSLINSDKACQYIASELTSWSLEPYISSVVAEWNSEVLSKVTTTDKSNLTLLEMLYSSLYKMHLMPSDRTGENPNWDTEEPTYDDFYTLWDTFRCLNSYYLLTAPKRAADIVRSLIDVWRWERFMPDARSGNYNGRVQGGSNADNVLADAYIKGLSAPEYGINWTDAYAAMKTDAELVPYNTFDYGDPTGSVKEGRGALPDWLSLGYVSMYDPDEGTGFGRCISRTVEYGLNDFALSQVAKDLAPKDYVKYFNRSAGWQQIWQHNLTSLNFTGFLAPLYANGTRDPSYSPLNCGVWCSWLDVTYEGLPWEYTWSIPYDMSTLISFMGGPELTESRLDAMFIPGLQDVSVGAGNGAGTAIFNPGNEPSFGTPFLYNYLEKRQWKSVMRSGEIINQYYSNGRDGVPGNSDAGALESWMVWNLLGLYPMVTQDVYLILSPWFSDLNISVACNKTLKITTEGLDQGPYIQSLTVNGESWNKSWLTHGDLINGNGGSLHFVLGGEQTEWDVGDVPPSPGHLDLGIRN